MIAAGWRFAGVLSNDRVVLETQTDQCISTDQDKQTQKTSPT